MTKKIVERGYCSALKDNFTFNSMQLTLLIKIAINI